MTPNPLEALTGAAQDALEAVQSPTIDHAPHLQALGLTEAQITPELLTRFQEALRLYQASPEANLALLEERVMGDLNSATATVEERTTALTTWIAEQEANAPTLTDGVQGAVDGAINAGTNAIQTEVERGFRGMLDNMFTPIREWFADSTFGRIIKSMLLAILPATWATRLFGEQTPDPAEDGTETGGAEDGVVDGGETTTPPVEAPVIDPSGSETVAETDEIRNKREGARDAGFRIMIQISGMDYGENNSAPGIYESLSGTGLSIGELVGSLRNSNLQTLIESEPYPHEDIRDVILGITGPINGSLLEGRIGQAEIQSILGFQESGSFNDVARVYFSEAELAEITQNRFEYERLPLGIVAKLLTLSYRETVVGISQMVSGASSSIGTTFINALFGQDVYNELHRIFGEDEVENDIYPDGMARALSNDLTGQVNRDFDVETLIGDESISDEDRSRLEEFVVFRDTTFPYIQSNFSLGIEGFSENLDTQVGNGEIVALFLALRGKDITTLTDSDNVIVYAWVYNVLSADFQGAYTARMIRQIAESSSEGELNHVMTAVLFRIAEFDREMTFNTAERIVSGADQAVMDQVRSILGESLAGNETILRVATWAVEVGGFALLMKILFKMPVMRAVLIATSGVVGASIYFGLKEGIYQSLDADIRTIYDDYIDVLIANGALGSHTRETLTVGIRDDSIGYDDIMLWLSSVNVSEILGEYLN